jgi:hypothetical protein
MNEAKIFFNEIQNLVNNNKKTAALDLVSDTVEDLVLCEEFGKTSGFLAEAVARIDSLPTSVFLSILTATKLYPEKLIRERKTLALAIQKKILKEGESTDSFPLLNGLI